jgi:hypothetical protein
LDLGYNEIEDINPLAGLDNLKELDLSHNRVAKLNPLAGILVLKALSASYNPLDDPKEIQFLAQLRELRFNGIGLTDLSFLDQLAGLELLELRDNAITDLEMIARLPELRHLDLGHNKIEDISFLGKLTKLRRLFLKSNNIKDIAPINRLRRLIELDLSRNLVDDLLGLNKLPLLADLDLRYNCVVNIEPLRTLTRLKRVDLSNNSHLDEVVMGDFLRDLETDLEKAAQEESMDRSTLVMPPDPLTIKPLDEGPLLVPVDELNVPLVIPKAPSLPDDPMLRAQLLANFFNILNDYDGFKENMADVARPPKTKLRPGARWSRKGEEKDSGDSDWPDMGAELRKLLESNPGMDMDEIIAKVCQPNPDEPPDDGVVYNSLDEIEGLPPELLNILKQFGGEGAQVRVRTLKKTISDIPDLPKGAIVIRCQVESSEDDPEGEHQEQRPHRRQGVIIPSRSRAGRSDSTFPFLRLRNPDGSPQRVNDDEENRSMEQMFFLLNYNPAKYSIH